MTSFDTFDPNRPQNGQFMKSAELREQLKAIATSNASSIEPSLPAIIVSDLRFYKKNITSKYSVSITINGVTNVVDLRTNASVSASATATEMVASINTAFQSLGTVAYVYGTEANDSSSYIALVAPGAGSNSTITLSNGTGSADALDYVFGIASRGSAVPYTVTGADLPEGSMWYKTVNTDSGELNLYLGAPARVISQRNLANNVNLSRFENLRIKITITPGLVIGPLTINVAGSSASSTTVEEIRDAINAAFTASPSWPASSNGPASIVTKEGTGKYLQVVSGPYDAPTVGPYAQIELSGLSGGFFPIDDAIEVVFGLVRGEAGQVFRRLPHTFKGSLWSNTMIRGIGERSGPGIGPWGTTMETALNIPAVGRVDGEVRVSKDTGIPWIFRQGQFGTYGQGWRRAVPGFTFPISYDTAAENYKLTLATDDFVSEPLGTLAAFDESRHLECGSTGHVVSLIDGRDSLWPNTDYSAHPTEGNRSLHRPAPIADDFYGDGVSSLSRGSNGVPWATSGSNIVGVPGLAIADNTISTTETRVLRGASGGQFVLLGAGNGTVGPYAFTADTHGTNILPGTFSLHAIDRTNPTGGTNISGYTTDASTNITGSGIASGSVVLSSGSVTVTFSSSLPSTHDIYASFMQSNEVIVCVKVQKSGEERAGGNAVTAGLIYGSHQQNDGGFNTGYAVKVSDSGIGSLSYRAGTSTDVVLSTFIVDPPLDTTERVLRVVYGGNGSGGYQHTIFWNGSENPKDWEAEYNAPPPGLSVSDTAGGVELAQPNKIVLSYTETGSPYNLNHGTCGLLATPAAATGSYAAKSAIFRNFHIHGGHYSSFVSTVPALPPVSAVRLRDTINSVRLAKDGVVQDGIITDTSNALPFILNLIGSLATDSSIDVDNRILSLGYDLKTKLRDTNILWHPTNNPNGKIAIWMGDNALWTGSGLANSYRPYPLNVGSVIGYGPTTTPWYSTHNYPSGSTWMTTSLPFRWESTDPGAALVWSNSYIVVPSAVTWKPGVTLPSGITSATEVTAFGIGPTGTPSVLVNTSPAGTYYEGIRLQLQSSYAFKIQTVSILGISVRV